MSSATRETVQVEARPEINAVPEAVQNHRREQQDEEKDDELGIVKRAKDSDFTAITMQNQAANSESSVETESLRRFLDGENQQ